MTSDCDFRLDSDTNKKKKTDSHFVHQDPKDPFWRELLEEVLDKSVTNPPTIPYKPVGKILSVETDEEIGTAIYRMRYTVLNEVILCNIQFTSHEVDFVEYIEVDKLHCIPFIMGKGKKHTLH